MIYIKIANKIKIIIRHTCLLFTGSVPHINCLLVIVPFQGYLFLSKLRT
ncbi:hypothetical protein BBAD15_m00013 (mitochondrion) [Beauveria bassiana D1-5]|uniref:Uncharacterized protein n=1 Tax=Beauveria bassiana D1-5 TaxID=1245745 RepID=A0A0A2V417_BEABA|nr:hypothetical protein BBAD15_m00013 [Beauveria bassiana D1-5]